ncbi:hypothetical protein [Oceanobacillus locisalsi]|uniref:Uncharacterized protein n=1 Tax=Oceanobacillus locisalsi TaxID=546107 RepID=A0ABW3NDG4_9BACI
MIYLNLYRWFYEKHLSYQDIEMAIEEIIPSSYRRMLEEYKEDYAAGIVRLRKKYPILYKYFKKDWDELFEELT